MANLTATAKLILVYTAPGSSTAITVPVMLTPGPYQASSVGFVDIADATAGATEFAVPFGSIATGASLAVIRNSSGQDLELKVNGALTAVDLPIGGTFMLGAADLAAGTPLTSLAVVTTGVQSGAGQVEYFVFGDPEAAA